MTEPEETAPQTEEVAFDDVAEAHMAFERMTVQRHAKGAEEYGELTYLQVDTITMALEELADFANYTRYTFVKLYLLQKRIQMQAPTLTLGRDAVSNPFQRG